MKARDPYIERMADALCLSYYDSLACRLLPGTVCFQRTNLLSCKAARTYQDNTISEIEAKLAPNAMDSPDAHSMQRDV